MASSAFTLLCSHHRHPPPELLHHLRWKRCALPPRLWQPPFYSPSANLTQPPSFLTGGESRSLCPSLISLHLVSIFKVHPHIRVLFIFIMEKYTQHDSCHCGHSHVYSSVASDAFPALRSHHRCCALSFSSSFTQTLCPVNTDFPFSQPLVTTILFSVFMIFPF